MSRLLSCVSLPSWASPLCISMQELPSSRLKTAGKALARERPRPKPHSRIRRFDAWSRVQRARGPGEQPPAPTEAPPSRRRTPRASKTPKHGNSDREDGETRRRGLGAAPVSRAKGVAPVCRGVEAQSPLRAPSALSADKSTRSSPFPNRPRILPGPRPSADA